MTTKYFNVKTGLTTGNITLDAGTGNITSTNANLGNLATANYFHGAFDSSSGAQPNITSTGRLSSLVVGNSTANITMTNSDGNGFLTATGNITAQYFIGSFQGSVSGTLVVPGNNTAVLFNDNGQAGASDGLTFNKTSNTLTLNGNVTSNNANLGNLVTANYHSGNGYYLTGLNASNLASGTISSTILGNSSLYIGTTSIALNRASGAQSLTGITSIDGYAATVSTNAQPNITSLGTLSGLNVSGGVTITGDAAITGNLAVTGSVNYVNTTSLDIQDPIIELGNGANGAALVSNDNKDRGTLLHYYSGSAKNAFIGWDNSAAEFGVGSDVTEAAGIITWNSYGNLHVGNIIGNGQALTSINGANVTGTVPSATSATSATTAGTVTTAAQPNITSTGALVGLTATGTIDLTGASNVSLGPVGNVHITGGTSGYLLSTDGSGGLSWVAAPSTTKISNGFSNVSIPTADGNIRIVANATVIANFAETGANIYGYANITGNITAGNVAGGNLVSANYFSGNGSLLTSITAANVTGTLSSSVLGGSSLYIGTTSIALNRASGAQSLTGITSIDGYAATVSGAAQGNITSLGTLTSVAVTGNATVGNVVVDGGLLSNRANVNVTTNTVIDEFAPATYRTAKYVISASGTNGYQSAEVLLVQDGTNSYITIYGSLCSNASADIVDFSSNINGVSGNVSLYATASGASTKVNLVATYLKT